MELDCTMLNKVTLFTVDDREGVLFPITVFREDGNPIALTKYGQYTNADFAKCVIFPKGKTTWKGFQRPFKDGDIVRYLDSIAIFKEWGDETLFRTHVTAYSHGDYTIDVAIPLFGKSIKREARFATEEEKQKLFEAIKAHGYKWNSESKTLEKLPKFKVGDKVRHKNNHSVVFTITSMEEDSYVCGAKVAFWFDDQDKFELVPNKFDITTLKPFDNCKYSLDGGITWKYAQYWFIQEKYNTNDISIELWQG